MVSYQIECSFGMAAKSDHSILVWTSADILQAGLLGAKATIMPPQPTNLPLL